MLSIFFFEAVLLAVIPTYLLLVFQHQGIVKLGEKSVKLALVQRRVRKIRGRIAARLRGLTVRDQSLEALEEGGGQRGDGGAPVQPRAVDPIDLELLRDDQRGDVERIAARVVRIRQWPDWLVG